MRCTGCNFAPATRGLSPLEDQLFGRQLQLEDVNTFAAAEGFYELGEIRRLRGDVDGALRGVLFGPVVGRRPATR